MKKIFLWLLFVSSMVECSDLRVNLVDRSFVRSAVDGGEDESRSNLSLSNSEKITRILQPEQVTRRRQIEDASQQLGVFLLKHQDLLGRVNKDKHSNACQIAENIVAQDQDAFDRQDVQRLLDYTREDAVKNWRVTRETMLDRRKRRDAGTGIYSNQEEENDIAARDYWYGVCSRLYQDTQKMRGRYSYQL